MNLKSIAAVFAFVTAASTSTAMAEVTLSAHATANLSASRIVRDHRVARPLYVQPVYTQYSDPYAPTVRDHRGRDARCETSNRRYRQPESIVLATTQLGGTSTHLDRQVLRLNRLRGVDSLTFAWVSGNTSIKQVFVTYANGQTELINVGDALTQNVNNRFTRTVNLANRPISHITITGYGWGSNPAESTFQVIASC